MPNETRSVLTVSFHKIIQVAGSMATVMVVPRLLGVENYGKFAFILTISYLGQILGDFGTLDIFGSFVPRMGYDARQRLYMHMLTFKIAVGFLCGGLTLMAAWIFTDWIKPGWAVLVGAGVALHIISWVPFQFSLGLSRIGTWMTEQAWRQWFLLIGIVILFPLVKFSGVVIALGVMEAAFCLGGLIAARDYFRTHGVTFSWKYFRSFLNFGRSFYFSNLITVALFRSGPILVYFMTGDTVETGYTDLAIGLFLLIYVTVSQFAQSLIPHLAKLLADERREAVRKTLYRFVLIGLILISFGPVFIWLLAERLALLVFGTGFEGIAPALKWMSLAMPLSVVLWAGNVLATVTGRGKVKLQASVSALFIFFMASWGLVPSFHAAGIAQALIASLICSVSVLFINLRSELTAATASHNLSKEVEENGEG